MENIDKLKIKLKTFNDVLEKRKMYYTIYLFGAGLGIYHLKEEYRMSNDLDYMSQTQINDEDTRYILDALEINDMGGIMMVPELSEIEIVEEIKYTYLTVLIPSIENFALSKLLSNRIKDYNDLANYPILDKCDISKLRDMLEEYLPYYVFNDKPDYNFNFLNDLLTERQLTEN